MPSSRGWPSNTGQAGSTSSSAPWPNAAQTPGNSLYLVADSEGRRLAGNLSAVSPDLWNSLGPVEFVYRRPAAGGRRAAARLRQCVPAAERLPADRRPRHRGSPRACAHGPFGHAVGARGDGPVRHRRRLLGEPQTARPHRHACPPPPAPSWTAISTGRLPVNGSGDELDRLSESLNLMLARIEQLMAGLREVSDNIAHDLKTPLNRLRNRVEARVARAIRRAGLSRGAGADHRGGRRADQDVQRAALDRAHRGRRRRREPRDARCVGAVARRGRALRAGRRGARARC